MWLLIGKSDVGGLSLVWHVCATCDIGCMYQYTAAWPFGRQGRCAGVAGRAKSESVRRLCISRDT